MARASHKRGLTSIPTFTHIVPHAPQLVRVGLPEPVGYRALRTLWVPNEIEAILSARGVPNDFVDTNLQAFLQRYIAGLYVTGSVSGDPKKLKPDFERLENLNEVWAMCFRAPHFNQWRLFGRFAARDTFIGLALYRRSFLDGKVKYNRCAEDFIRHWAATMANASVLIGTQIENYISKPVRDPYANVI